MVYNSKGHIIFLRASTNNKGAKTMKLSAIALSILTVSVVFLLHAACSNSPDPSVTKSATTRYAGLTEDDLAYLEKSGREPIEHAGHTYSIDYDGMPSK